jgi:hypothetical protein
MYYHIFMSLKNLSISLFLVLLLTVFPTKAFADEHFLGNVEVDGNVAVNGGEITSTAWMGKIFDNNVGNISIGNNAYWISLGNYWGTTYLQGELSGHKATFMPNWIDDVTIYTDSDSTLVLHGLNTASGDPLCIDGSDNVVKCGEAFSMQAGNTNTNLEQKVNDQQKEIDHLKKEIEDLKALVKN